MDGLVTTSKTTLDVPQIIGKTFPVKVFLENKKSPFQHAVTVGDFKMTEEHTAESKRSVALDQSFFLNRHASEEKPGWTDFNRRICHNNPNQMLIGHMRIILAPAHEYDTLNTVIKRCVAVSEYFKEKHTVITGDQALYCKLQELKWLIPEYKERLIPRLGGLHISMNFIRIITHMSGSGIKQVWIESDLLGKGTVEAVLNCSGESYYKAMRSHKITIQALWEILIPELLTYISEADNELCRDIVQSSQDADKLKDLISLLQSDVYCKSFSKFIENECNINTNFKFWWQYIEMVSILLSFTRAQRQGNWHLHIASFKMMIPYFFHYDHQNYACWGIVYIAEMNRLPREVLSEFEKGEFVIKFSQRSG